MVGLAGWGYNAANLNPRKRQNPWWRHQMETFAALLALCAGNSPVPVNSPHKGQWRGSLMFSLIYAWINDWVNNREAGDLRRQRGHYDVIVMPSWLITREGEEWGVFYFWFMFYFSGYSTPCIIIIIILERIGPRYNDTWFYQSSSWNMVVCRILSSVADLADKAWDYCTKYWSAKESAKLCVRGSFLRNFEFTICYLISEYCIAKLMCWCVFYFYD